MFFSYSLHSHLMWFPKSTALCLPLENQLEEGHQRLPPLVRQDLRRARGARLQALCLQGQPQARTIFFAASRGLLIRRRSLNGATSALILPANDLPTERNLTEEELTIYGFSFSVFQNTGCSIRDVSPYLAQLHLRVQEEREIDGYNKNNPTMMKPGGFQEGIPMESRKFTEEMGNKRQALRDIKNFVGAPPPYPRAINKRRLPDKSALDDNNQQFAGHRPMTRKFAASLAEKQLSHQDISRRNDKIKNEKSERAIPSIPNSNNLENITVIDVEEYMDPLPDYVKQTEAMLEEMEAMMKWKGVGIKQVYDACALRVVIGDTNGKLHGAAVKCCYNLLNIVHRLWTPIDGEFDDYIVNPKPSGYQVKALEAE